MLSKKLNATSLLNCCAKHSCNYSYRYVQGNIIFNIFDEINKKLLEKLSV